MLLTSSIFRLCHDLASVSQTARKCWANLDCVGYLPVNAALTQSLRLIDGISDKESTVILA